MELEITHDGGTTSEYDEVIDDFSILTVTQGAALGGSNCGLNLAASNGAYGIGIKNLAADVATFRLRFYVNLNSWNVGAGDEFINLVEIHKIGGEIVGAVLAWATSTAVNFIAMASNDSSGQELVYSPALEDIAVEHCVEVLWQANDGGVSKLKLWVDGVYIGGVSFDGDTNLAAIRILWLGVTVAALTSGMTVYLDEIKANDTGVKIGMIGEPTQLAGQVHGPGVAGNVRAA